MGFGTALETIPQGHEAVLTERLKTLEKDRKNARPADEVFRRILQKPKPILYPPDGPQTGRATDHKPS